MVTIAFLVLALFLGYSVTVALHMGVSFGVAKVSPEFIAKDNRIRTSYKLFQETVWLVCTTLGSFAAALVIGNLRPWLGAIALFAALAGVLWANTWEARQRGLTHQILMTIATALGVVAGFLIYLKTIGATPPTA